MHTKPLIGLIAFAAIGLAACGSSGGDATPGYPTSAITATSASTPATTAKQAAASITLADTALGKIFADSEGRTLYAFTNDTGGTSTCTGACAKAWPAATVTADPVRGPGITATLSLVDAPGGGKMVKAGKWPLYRFAGDVTAGDTNGEGSGGVWFVVRADGTLVKS
jgi:predicted lipoprotein with Yx(FWY)xxD motif